MPDGGGPGGGDAGRRGGVPPPAGGGQGAGRGRPGRGPGPPASGEGGDEPPRASLWSVPEAHRRLYFGLFALAVPGGVGLEFLVCY